MVPVVQGALFYNNLYNFRSFLDARALLSRFAGSVILATLVLALAYWAVPALTSGRGVTLVAFGFDAIGLAAWRWLVMRYTRSRPLYRVVIIGNGELAQELSQMIRAREGLGYRMVGFMTAPSASVGVGDKVGTYDQLAEIVRNTHTDLVVVALADRRGSLPVDTLLDSKFIGVQTAEGVDLYEAFTQKIYVKDLHPSWMIFGSGFRQTDMRKATKRLVDVVVSSFALAVLALPSLLTALLVRLTSPGAAICVQERVGEFGTVFTLYKFRSMRIDAEADGPKLATNHEGRATRLALSFERRDSMSCRSSSTSSWAT
ncbi:MAG: hypothetical protein EXR76_13940 [Myxococcales bacterium]|nr:hypothetical protein [Myxococcales bacterium]